MGTLDAVLLAIIAVSAIVGAIRGVVRQIGIAIGVVLGITLALRHGSVVTLWLSRWIASAQVRGVLGPALVFLGVYLAVVGVAILIHRLMAKAYLGWINRTAGAALAVAAVVLLMGAGLLVAVAHVPSSRPAIARSPVAVEVIRASHVMIGLVPAEVRHAFTRGWSEVQELIRGYRAHPSINEASPSDST